MRLDALCRATRCGASDTLIAQRLAAHLWKAHERIVSAPTAGAFGLQTPLAFVVHRSAADPRDMAVIDREELERLLSRARVACAMDKRALDILLITIRGCHTYNELSNAITDGIAHIEHIAARLAHARSQDARRDVVHALGSMVSDKTMSALRV